MKYEDACKQQCGIARTAALLGERWTLLILREIMFLDRHRFDQIQNSLGLSRHLLSVRLKELCANNILAHRPPQKEQKTSEYHLTESGRQLMPVLTSILTWGERHMLKPGESPVVKMHTDCNHSTEPYLTCSHCSQKIGPSELELVAK